MPSPRTFHPDWVSAPGDTIVDVLRERKLSLSELANALGQSLHEVNQLVTGRSTITIAVARKLSVVLGASIEFWMSRDFEYREQVKHQRHVWLNHLPVKDMIEFGWIKAERDPSEQATACLTFFDVPSISAWHSTYANIERAFAFRTSPSFESSPGALAAWLRKGEVEAARIRCASWNPAGFRDSLKDIRALTRDKDPLSFVLKLQQLNAAHGVKVVIVRAPSGCRASGATRFLSPDEALLLLSFRYLSDDQFWFSYFHEAAHILLHGMDRVFLEGIQTDNSIEEQQANEFAASVLIPNEFKKELLKLRPGVHDIVRFARRIGVSPGIVVGQLQHYGRIRPQHFNGLKRRYEW